MPEWRKLKATAMCGITTLEDARKYSEKTGDKSSVVSLQNDDSKAVVNLALSAIRTIDRQMQKHDPDNEPLGLLSTDAEHKVVLR